MRNPEPRGRQGRHRRWSVLLLAGLVTQTAATATAGPPSSANVVSARTERLGQTPKRSTPPKATPRRRTTRRPAAKAAAPARPARELRVTSDVPGAMVFLDRKYIGTTPLVSPDVAAGPHQLNVQVEGRPPVVQAIEVAASGPTAIAVVLAAAAVLDAQVAVVHEHARGSCEGLLHATPDGLRYVTPHKDAFSVTFADVKTFTVDYAGKRLRLEPRRGRAWTFTTRAETADPLFVFHRDVDAARKQ